MVIRTTIGVYPISACPIASGSCTYQWEHAVKEQKAKAVL